MSDEEALLRAIREDRNDDTIRQVYADWLEERGDPRAEFLRLQPHWPRNCARLWELRQQLDRAWLTLVGKGRRFGDQRRFAIEVGEFYFPEKRARRVDIWAADRWLTCDDNNA